MNSTVPKKKKYLFLKDETFIYSYKREALKSKVLKLIKKAFGIGYEREESMKNSKWTPLPEEFLQYYPEISYYCNLFDPIKDTLLHEVQEMDSNYETFLQKDCDETEHCFVPVQSFEDSSILTENSDNIGCKNSHMTFNKNKVIFLDSDELNTSKPLYDNSYIHTLASAGEDVYMQTEILNEIREFDQNSEREKWDQIFEKCLVYCPPNHSPTENSATMVNISANNSHCNEGKTNERFIKKKDFSRQGEEHKSISFAVGCKKMVFDKNESCESFKESIKLFTSNVPVPQKMKSQPRSCLKKKENMNYVMESQRAKGCDLVEVDEFERFADKYDEEKSTLQRSFSCYRLRQVSSYHLLNDDLRKSLSIFTGHENITNSTFLGYGEENQPQQVNLKKK